MPENYSEIILTALLGTVLLILAVLLYQAARGDGGGFVLPRWSSEPALIVGVVQAALAVGLAFGLDLSETQQAALLALAAALFGGSVVTRSRVSPVTS